MLKRILALVCISLLLMSLFTVAVSAERRTSLPVTLKSTVPEKVVIKRFELESVTKKGEEKEIVFNVGYTKDKSWQFGIYLDAYDAEGCTVGRYTLGLKGDVGYNESTWTLKTTDPIATFVISAQKATSDSSSYYYREYMTVYSADGREMDISVLQEPDYKEVGWSESVVLYSYNDGKFTAGISVKPYEIEEYRKQGWYTEEETKNTVTMYAQDDAGNFTRTLVVPERLIDTYRNVGWYTEGEKYLKIHRKTELPIELVRAAYGGNEVTRIDKFDIVSVENLPGKYLNRIHYELECTDVSGSGSSYMILYCYDAAGEHIKTVNIRKYNDYVDVPDTTAMIELSIEKEAENNQMYFYCEYANVYATDGRVLKVPTLQVPIYELVGWHGEVAMYAKDEAGNYTRSIKISPFEVEAYEAVGWSSKERILYDITEEAFNEFKGAKQYPEMFNTTLVGVGTLSGTRFEQKAYDLRTKAMDTWRSAIGRPMGVMGYNLSENSIGTPKISIAFANISYKKVIAYKVKFTCYDVFGNVEGSYYDTFYDDDANIAAAGTVTTTWTLYGADSVHTVKNIRVIEVVYEDGTKWYGK